jgi:hypothetical protein
VSSTATGRSPESCWYEIRLQGRLDQRWSDWFDGLTLTTDQDGTTRLRGPLVDQAALHGVLQRLRDLGVPLISVTRVQPDPAPPPASSDSPVHPPHTTGDPT